MKRRNTFCMLSLTLLLGTTPERSRAQSVTDLETYLQHAFDRIGRFYNQVREYRTDPPKSAAYADSLRDESEQLRTYLLATLPRVPGSIEGSIQIPEALWLTTSPDRQLRVWAWDTKTGGEQPQIVMLYEYRTASGVKVVDLRPTGSTGYAPDWYDTIYTVTTKQGATYYVPFVNSQYSSSKVSQRLDALTIVDGRLRHDERLFIRADHTPAPVAIQYDYFKNYSEKLGRERFKIKLSPDLQMLSVPVVVGDSLTADNQRYRFDGMQYVLQTTSK